MLNSVYGISSVLIPIFLLVCSIVLISGKWNYRFGVYLAISVIPFFTFVGMEKFTNSLFSLTTPSILIIKYSTFVFVSLLLVVIEYLIAGMIIDFVVGKSKNSKKVKISKNSQISEKSKNEQNTPIQLVKKAEKSEETESENDDETFENEESEVVEKEVSENVAEVLDNDEIGNEELSDFDVIESEYVPEAEYDDTELDEATISKTDKKEASISEYGKLTKPSVGEMVEIDDDIERLLDEEYDFSDEDEAKSESASSVEKSAESQNLETAEDLEALKAEKKRITQAEIEALLDIGDEDFDDEESEKGKSKENEAEPTVVEVDFDDSKKPEMQILDDENAESFKTEDSKTGEQNAEETEQPKKRGLLSSAMRINESVEAAKDYQDPREAAFLDNPFDPSLEEDNVETEISEDFSEPNVETDSFDETCENDDTIEEKKNDQIILDEENADDSGFGSIENDENLEFEVSEDIEVDEIIEDDSEDGDLDDSELDEMEETDDSVDSDFADEVDSDEIDSNELDTEDIEAGNISQNQAKTLIKPIKAYHIPIEGVLDNYESNPYWIIDEDTKQAGQILKETLSEFKIAAEVTGIRKGPVVTMFEILPAPGVRLSKIVNLQDNIALRLAAQSVRIVAPIPGKHAVGIEVPNQQRSVVSFRELIEKDLSAYNKMSLPVVLGKDITGDAQLLDITTTPHLLIAGSTGSGKSVCVNSLILSILYKRSPRDVKMILIDPKVVELKLYNDIPHLLTPVITEPKKAFQALQYCLCEMERRYALLDHMGVRDIKSYNRRIKERHVMQEELPYIVVVIDEFADLMATTGKELESTVARLAAMSRAVGIHLVLATQRPSIDVITGLIKANIPTRIAFMVASKTDSRIIIDQGGAEKLLGKGDMLYASAIDPFPVRIQGTFVAEDEVERVVECVKAYGEPDYIDEEIFVDEDEDEENNASLFTEGEDPLYERALEIVMQAGKASASYIQRRLKIGYNRAARLVEEMEARGIVGPANGSKPRELIKAF